MAHGPAVRGTTKAGSGSRSALASGINVSTAAETPRPRRPRPHDAIGAEARLPPPRLERGSYPCNGSWSSRTRCRSRGPCATTWRSPGFEVPSLGDGSARARERAGRQARPDRARPRSARDRWAGRRAGAPADVDRADRDAHRARRRVRPDRRARARRRRLPGQTVQPEGARRARTRRAAPYERRRRGRRGPARRRRRDRPAEYARPRDGRPGRPDADRVPAAGDARARAGACVHARASCWMRSTASRSSRTSARSTRT